MICAGIDLGSRNTKLVIYDSAQAAILFSACTPTSTQVQSTIAALFEQAAALAPRPARIAATGYGRQQCLSAGQKLSEISCHAAGVRYYFPDCHAIIDIGGQDSKLISLDERVKDFMMNDKCAAGTGRFLEMTALKLGIALEEMSSLASAADCELHLSSTCVVFAESEIIGLLAEDTSLANVLRAVHNSIAKRILAQAAHLNFESPIVFTGGVALNDDLHNCLQTQFQATILRPPDPEITGALGAALLACK